MASALTTSKLLSSLKVRQNLSGDKTTAAAVAWYDMRDYAHFLAVINLAVKSGNGVEAFSIVADAASDGSSGNETIKTHATPTTCDAAGDMLVLECTAEEIRQIGDAAGKGLRYVAIKLETHSASDQVLCTNIFGGARFNQAALTADVVA